MSTPDHAEDSRELTLLRLIDAPPELLFRAWTEPALLKQWFTPKPWTVASAKTEVRAGAAKYAVPANEQNLDRLGAVVAATS
jgi:uncharacterized protein YndB with AHSA1/START domain